MHLEQLTEVIIGCAYKVANSLGNGFLEKVYENSLAHELRKKGLQVEQQPAIAVRYDGVVVHYLKATDLTTCLLINFGGLNVQIKRIVNTRSGSAEGVSA